ncbi:hypothetical protein BDZ89DRAFT_1038254 [Hymenopellis radicata]|nr:hypothetical protein BDZ89DRAFT_1038254 [Hymenopellis radicata]
MTTRKKDSLDCPTMTTTFTTASTARQRLHLHDNERQHKYCDEDMERPEHCDEDDDPSFVTPKTTTATPTMIQALRRGQRPELSNEEDDLSFCDLCDEEDEHCDEDEDPASTRGRRPKHYNEDHDSSSAIRTTTTATKMTTPR